MHHKLKVSLGESQGKNSINRIKKEDFSQSPQLTKAGLRVYRYAGAVFVSEAWINFSKSSISRRNPA